MLPRRAFLVSMAVSALAGCAFDDDSETAGTSTVTAGAAGTATEQPAGTTELDLREANVVEVAFDGEPGGDVRFDVTLFHDDDGEDGYADWWQVEALDGTRLGRRELLHAHSTAPFTRSATIAVPADRRCVVVRGHDQTHGYGGRAMAVNLDSGAMAAIDQGDDPTIVDDSHCP